MYSLIYTSRARRDIKRLDIIVQKRLKKSLEYFRERPLYYAEKLQDRALGNYRFRVGNYRVIFDSDNHDIVILRVGHRREIYR